MNNCLARVARLAFFLGLGGCASGPVADSEYLARLERRQELIIRRMEIDREARGPTYDDVERLQRQVQFETEQRHLAEAAAAGGRVMDTAMRMMQIGKPQR